MKQNLCAGGIGILGIVLLIAGFLTTRNAEEGIVLHEARRTAAGEDYATFAAWSERERRHADVIGSIRLCTGVLVLAVAGAVGARKG